MSYPRLTMDSPVKIAVRADEIPATVEPTLVEVYQWALSQGQGLSPVPCHPEFVTKKGKGKAPSVGPSTPIKWESYKSQQPTLEQCQEWAATVPGLGVVVSGEFIVIDVDFSDLKDQPKQREKAIAGMVATLIERCPKLATTYRQKSGSGGAHLFAKVIGGQALGTAGTGSYNLVWDGVKVGELKKNFVVLAPSLHPSGDRYQAVNGLCAIAELTMAEFEALDVVKFVAKTETKTRHDRKSSNIVGKSTVVCVSLEDCICQTAKDRLQGQGLGSDRSSDLWTVASECYGWEAWLTDQGVTFTGSADELVERMDTVLGYQSGDALRKSDKARSEGSPAADEKGCWKRVGKLNVKAFEQRCPDDVKEAIAADTAAWNSNRRDSAATWKDRPDHLVQIESELAAGGFILTEYDWILLTETDFELSLYQVCAENNLSTEKPPMGKVRSFAFSRLDKVFKAVPEVLELATCQGYWWIEYLRFDRKVTHDTLAIHRTFGDRLKYNALLMQPEVEGVAVNPETVKNLMETEHRITLRGTDSEVIASVEGLARVRTFSPVVEYLESCRAAYNPDLTIRAILDKVFDIAPDSRQPKALDMYEVYLKNFFVGAVARAYKPGVKFRSVLVLKGDQNIGKSEFFHILAGAWFDDSITLSSDKDDKMKLARTWIAEWQELDSVIGKKEVGLVKSFISSSTDIIRLPYGRVIKDMPRPSVLCSTVNEDSFLVDTTGNTRYEIIDIGGKQPDLEWLRLNRDAVWAMALTLFESGAKFWIDEKDQASLQADMNLEYQSADPWMEIISAKTAHLDAVTSNQILDAIEGDIAKQTKGALMRVAGILKLLGWTKDDHQTRSHGHKVRFWRKEPIEPEPKKVEVDVEVGEAIAF